MYVRGSNVLYTLLSSNGILRHGNLGMILRLTVGVLRLTGEGALMLLEGSRGGTFSVGMREDEEEEEE